MATGKLGRERRDEYSRATRRSALFWRYWSGSSISLAGTAISTVALPLTAIELLNASSFEVSWLTAASYFAWFLIGLPAGVIVQRFPLRGIQIAMDLIRGAVLASVPLAAWAGVLTISQLTVVALVVGLASVVFDVGDSSMLPFIVPEEELTVRNSMMDGSVAVTQTGGPSLGGLLVQLLGAPGAIIADAVSYAISALFMSTLPRPRPQRSAQGRGPMLKLIKDGCMYVVGHPVIGPCTLYQTVTNLFAGGLLALTPVFLVRTLDAPPWLVGFMIATEGVGGVLGATLASRLAGRMGTARAVVVSAIADALFALLMPSAVNHWWGFAAFGIGNAAFSAGVVVGNVLTRTYRQTAVPSDLFPRVMATVRFISWGVIPVGALASGALASAAGNRLALSTICLVNFGAPLSLLLSRVRGCRDLADASP